MSTQEYSSSSTRKPTRSSMGAASVNISVGTKNRGVPTLGSSSRRSNVVSRVSYGGGGVIRPTGDVVRMSTNTVQAVSGNRQHEKSELADLNTKLAGFIEHKQFQAATIEALQAELERLKKSKGFNQEKLREMFKDEIADARDALKVVKVELGQVQAENLKLDSKIQDLTDELGYRTKQLKDSQLEVSKLSTLIGELEGELNASRRSLENCEREKNVLKEDLEHCRIDNDKLRDETTMAREKQIALQNELDSLYEEREFECATWQEENGELLRIIEELRNVTPKIQSKWKSDFQECIRVIQEDYNNRLMLMEQECKRRYDDQLNQLQDNVNRDNTDGTILKNENKKLKHQLAPLDDKIRDLKDELSQYQNAQIRDQHDNISKQENKGLKASLSQNKSQMSSLQSENDRLRNDIDRLNQLYKDECDDCAKEKGELNMAIAGLQEELDQVQANLSALSNDNMSLTLEIACYKKLLEGEEANLARSIEQQSNMQTKGASVLSGIIGGGGGGGSGGSMSQSSNPQKDKPVIPATKKEHQLSGQGKQQPKSKAPELSESTGTVRLKRSSKGACSIVTIRADGGMIVLENTSPTKEQDLTGWRLSRKFGRNKSKEVGFTFLKGTVIKPGKQMKVFSDECSHEAGLEDVVAGKCDNFGHGNGCVYLKDLNEEPKSTCEVTYQG